MIKAKVIGAGSIGNHLTQAARQLGWEVAVVDTDQKALERMKNDIYPKRYGAWDESIKLFMPQEAPVGGFDVIFIGTPPDTHLKIATEVLKKEAPKVLQIEKPLCSPTLEGLSEFIAEAKKHSETSIIVGFNHLVAENTLKVEEIIKNNALGVLQSLDAEVRSHWQGILSAHPWLSGPEATYLGYWKRGGGAGGEHIHAINLWQHFAHFAGAGRVMEVSATFDYVSAGKALYDRACYLNLVTEKNLFGRVVQDVVTEPKRKVTIMQFEKGHVEWHNDVTKTVDKVFFQPSGGKMETFDIEKKRTDEFLREIEHIQKILNGETKIADSPMRLERGLDSMLVLAAAHKSFAEKKIIKVEYNY